MRFPVGNPREAGLNVSCRRFDNRISGTTWIDGASWSGRHPAGGGRPTNAYLSWKTIVYTAEESRFSEDDFALTVKMPALSTWIAS